MRITIEHHGNQFNVLIASREGNDPFLTIKGCRVVDGSKGRFVSWPATKNEPTGKWWNHVYASDAFAAEVLKAHDTNRPAPKPPQRSAAPAQRQGTAFDDMDSEIPF